jgi:antitoxin CptB
MDRETRLKRLKFRAWHRGTREADMMIGGYFEAYGANWTDSQLAWFEAFLEEQDVDIMAWGLRAQQVPENWQGEMIDAFQRLDFITPTV